MKKCMLALALTLAFSFMAFAQSSGTSYSGSQDTAKSKSSTASTDKTSTSSGKEKGVTGCLEQGSSAGAYVIKNAKHPEGIQVSYSGTEDLSKHVGHKVHATGSMSGDTLNATNVKHISETCSVSDTASGSHKHHHGDMSNSSTGDTNTNSNPSGTTTPK